MAAKWFNSLDTNSTLHSLTQIEMINIGHKSLPIDIGP